MSIRVYNSLTNRKEPLETVSPGKVGIYLCGPTVYKPSHIGHAVGPIIFDAIKRFLQYRGYEVQLVVNITDVDDKLIAEAHTRGMTVPALAEQVTRLYLEAMKGLGVTAIDAMPKASEHIGDIIRLCERLIANGAAYVSEGDVYFDVTADADYGKLSNRTADEQTGQRELRSGEKRHPGDFALWKAAKANEPDEVKFDSPWGKGRPGWHIECSAMSMAILGETFDIHGGGHDLIFPHHENEIAQSECATGKPFAKYWMHNGLTRFNTKKVSKSDPDMQQALEEMVLGNLLSRHSGELIRYLVLSTHYRSPIEFSEGELVAKRKGLATFHRLFDRVQSITGRRVYEAEAEIGAALAAGDGPEHVQVLAADLAELRDRFLGAMDDDFNTAAAIAALFEMATRVNRFVEDRGLETHPNDADAKALFAATMQLVELGRILGLFVQPPKKLEAGGELLERVLQAHLDVRAECRKAKDFAMADMVRDRLGEAGVQIEDKPSGAAWRIESTNGPIGENELLNKLVQIHIDVRQAFRKAKNFPMADAVRDRLLAAGITLEDKPGGTNWIVSGR